MNIFDIIGPVMVGPSSSHTAGVVRIGNVVHNMLGGVPVSATVKFHGSFAATYKGHGSDKAIVGGLLGFQPQDERLKSSLSLAEEKGIAITFEPVDLPNAHPNTLVVEATGASGEPLSVLAESVGGGNIMVRQINGTEVSFNGQYDTLVIHHEDTPGAIALVSGVLAKKGINIANMKVYRSRKSGPAIMVIETDGTLKKSLTSDVLALPNIHTATIITGLGQA